MGIYPQIIEDIFSRLEGKYQKALKDLLNSPQDQKLDEELKGLFCYFLAIQILRTRDTRNLVTQMQTKFLQALINDSMKLNFPEHTHLTPKVEMKYEVIAHLKVILNPEIVGPICEMLGNHLWLIGLNETGKPLYTSDTPIVKHHHLKHKYAAGWEGPGVEIVFPISPNHALILLERTVFEDHQEIDGRWVRLNETQVEHFNRLQVIHSHRQIYSSTDDFELVETVSREKPEVFLPNDDRVTVNLYDKESDEPGKIKKDLELLINPRD